MRVRRHYMPLWVSIPTLIIYLGVCVIISRTNNSQAAIPLYTFMGYWALIGVCNGKTVEISPSGVSLNYGPIPTGWPNKDLPIGEIQACAYHYFNASQDAGFKYNHNASVRTKHGACHNVLGPFTTEPEARAAAEKIASVLNQAPDTALNVVNAGYVPPGRQIRLAVIAFVWMFIGILCMAGSVWIEVARPFGKIL